MADILQDFPIKAPIERVFEAISTPAGLDQWWTVNAAGAPAPGATLALSFGPTYQWEARVTCYEPCAVFELEMTKADADWTGTRVRIELTTGESSTWVRFRHTGWPEVNEHYRISCHCWAMYLRVLRRFLEHGESVPYDDRLDV